MVRQARLALARLGLVEAEEVRMARSERFLFSRIAFTNWITTSSGTCAPTPMTTSIVCAGEGLSKPAMCGAGFTVEK